MSFMEMFEKANAKPSIDVTTLKKDGWYVIDLMGYMSEPSYWIHQGTQGIGRNCHDGCAWL